MLVVVEETPGLPFECAGHIVGCARRHSLIVCSRGIVLLMSSVFIFQFVLFLERRESAGCTETPMIDP